MWKLFSLGCGVKSRVFFFFFFFHQELPHPTDLEYFKCGYVFCQGCVFPLEIYAKCAELKMMHDLY